MLAEPDWWDFGTDNVTNKKTNTQKGRNNKITWIFLRIQMFISYSLTNSDPKETKCPAAGKEI